MFENVDGRTTDGRRTDAGVTGILIAHLRAFGSGELINGLVSNTVNDGENHKMMAVLTQNVYSSLKNRTL